MALRVGLALVKLAGNLPLLGWMAAGSVLGAALGGMLVGRAPTQWLLGLLGVVLLVSASKTVQHAH